MYLYINREENKKINLIKFTLTIQHFRSKNQILWISKKIQQQQKKDSD